MHEIVRTLNIDAVKEKENAIRKIVTLFPESNSHFNSIYIFMIQENQRLGVVEQCIKVISQHVNPPAK